MNYTLDELCHIEKGKIGITKAVDGEFPLVTTGEDFGTHNEYHFEGPAVCVPLVSSTGHGHASIKRLHYVEGKFACGNILAVLIPKDPSKLSAKFLYTYLTIHKQKKLVRKMKGAANVSLTLTNLKKVEIELPSLDEQKKLENYFEVVNNKTYEAIKMIGNTMSLASVLRMLYLRELTEKNVKSNCFDDYNSVLEDTSQFELPYGWKWKKIGEIASVKGGKRLPKGHSYIEGVGKWIYIRVKDLGNGTISDRDLKYIDDLTRNEIKKYTISSDDIYVTIAGTLGQVGLVPEKFSGMNLTENAAKISILDKSEVNKKWLYIYLESSFSQYQFKRKSRGAALQKLALRSIQDTLVPLPPYEIQVDIANKIDNMFENLDEMSDKLFFSQKKLNLLLQSALERAYG